MQLLSSFFTAIQMKIKYLPHTADIRMFIEGRTMPELFLAGLKGMSNLMKDGVCDEMNSFNSRITIRTISNDRTNLLVDFLSDALAQTYANKTLYCKMKVLHLREFEIIADLFGYPTEDFDEEIKAVTYHEAKVRKNSNKHWESLIIFDI